MAVDKVTLPPSAPTYATLMLNVAKAAEEACRSSSNRGELTNNNDQAGSLKVEGTEKEKKKEHLQKEMTQKKTAKCESNSHDEDSSPKDEEEGEYVAVTEPMVASAFEATNARVVFSQKVLSIFLLQTVVVNIIMEIFLYFEIFIHEIDFIRFFMVALVLFAISVVLMALGLKSRRKAACNFIILVYQPIGLTITFILVMRILSGVGYHGQELLETICKAWKSCVFSGVAVMIYSVFCIDFKHGMRLIYSMFVATGVFTSLYLCSILWYANKYPGSVTFTIFYINLVFYPMYLYILYDIDAMTKRDYRAARDPTDYVNSAVNLQMDFIFIIINFIQRVFSSCVKKQ